MEDSNTFTVKEIVIEILDGMKELRTMIERIDREGSIGTKSIQIEHENRLRQIEVLITQTAQTVTDIKPEVVRNSRFRTQALAVAGVFSMMFTAVFAYIGHLWR
jgi:hypothetical protein